MSNDGEAGWLSIRQPPFQPSHPSLHWPLSRAGPITYDSVDAAVMYPCGGSPTGSMAEFRL